MNNQSNAFMNKMIHEALNSAEQDLVVAPLSSKARNLIIKRKKAPSVNFNFFASLFNFISLQLKFVHAGITMLLLCGAFIYLNNNNEGQAGGTDLNDLNTYRSISHNTISVNSTTMLTSIPTLVIRN